MAKLTELKFIVILFVLWRLFLFVVSYFGVAALPLNESFPYANMILMPSGLPEWLWVWGNFDGVHYLTLAQRGYDGFGTQVFFPFYPLATRLLNLIFQNHLITALVVSNTATFLATVLLYRLVRRDFNEARARWAVVFLLFFPTSFFLGSIYTESTFLFLVLASFYLSGPVGTLFSLAASLTRLSGIFLAPAGLLIKPRNYFTSLALLGLPIFMTFLYLKFQNAFLFLSAQGAFANGRATSLLELVTPPQVVYRYLKILLTASYHHLDYWVAILELLSFLFALGVLVYLTLKKKTNPKYLIFGWLTFLLPTFSGTFSSMPRYLLSVFPLFIFLSGIRNIHLRYLFLGVSVVMLTLLTILFTRGYFVG